MASELWLDRSQKKMASRTSSEGLDQTVPDFGSSSISSAPTFGGGALPFSTFSSSLQFRSDETISLEDLIPVDGMDSWHEGQSSGFLNDEHMLKKKDAHSNITTTQESTNLTCSRGSNYLTQECPTNTGTFNVDETTKSLTDVEAQRLADEFLATEFPSGPPPPKKGFAAQRSSHKGNLSQRTEKPSHGQNQPAPLREDKMGIGLAMRGTESRHLSQPLLTPLVVPHGGVTQEAVISPKQPHSGSPVSRNKLPNPGSGGNPNARQELNESMGNFTCCTACIAARVPCDHEWPCGICQIDGTRCELVWCDQDSDCPKKLLGRKCIFLHEDRRDEIRRAQGDTLNGEPIPYIGHDLPFKTGTGHKNYPNNIVPEEVLARYPRRPKLEEEKRRVASYRLGSAHASGGSDTTAPPARGRPGRWARG